MFEEALLGLFAVEELEHELVVESAGYKSDCCEGELDYIEDFNLHFCKRCGNPCGVM